MKRILAVIIVGVLCLSMFSTLKFAFADPSPVISSVSTITATQLQTIDIKGSGFGNTWPQTTPVGDGSVDTVAGSARASNMTPWMDICDSGKYQKTGDTSDGGENWAAGVTDFRTVFCMVGIYITSWTDTEIVLGGFGTYLGTNGQGTWYIEQGDPLVVDVFTPSGQAAYHTTVVGAPPLTYSVTIIAHCNTEGVDLSVPIEEDGSYTGFDTPYTFPGLTGTHSFTVLDRDFDSHPFAWWDSAGSGEYSTTISVSSAGTHTAYYRTLPYPPENVVAAAMIGIELKWDRPRNLPTGYTVQSYNIYRGTSPDFVIPWNLPYRTVYSTTSFDDSVQDNNVYYYRVAANFQQGLGAPSDPVRCARSESVKGVISEIDFLKMSKVQDVFPQCFSIQQNIWIPMQGNIISGQSYLSIDEYYWVQNIIYVFGAGTITTWKMAGAMQVWRICISRGEKELVDCCDRSLGWPYNKACIPRGCEYSDVILLKTLVDGNTLKMTNNAINEFTFTFPSNAFANLPCSKEPFVAIQYGSPEIVIVGSGIGVSTVPMYPFVTFNGPIEGLEKSCFAVGAEMIGALNWAKLNPTCPPITYERSTGLTWDMATGSFHHDSSSADEGFWFKPDFEGASPNVPSQISASVLKSIVVNLQCPADLSITDSLGNLAGFNQTSGQIQNGIPFAFFLDVNTFWILDPQGTYTVVVAGQGNGKFTLLIWLIDENGQKSILWNKTETIMESERLSWVLSPTVSGSYIASRSTSPVGGEWAPTTLQTLAPTNTLQLLAPWISVASTIAIAASFVAVKRIKKRRD